MERIFVAPWGAARQKGISLSEYIRRALAIHVGYERGFEAGRWERHAERT